MKKTVVIKSRPRESALKIHEWTSAGGKKLNKTKLSPNSKDTFTPMYASSLGGRKTGLTHKVINPYKDYTREQLPEKWRFMIGVDEISLQNKLEYEHGRDPGFYTNVDSKDHKTPTFMSGFKMKFNDGSTILDLSIPEHELTYYWCLDTKFVANSKKELDEGKFPYAMFYIELDGEDDDLERTANETKNSAIARLVSPTMTPENMELVAKALGWFSGQSKAAMYNDITSRIMKVPTSKIVRADNDASKFLKVASLLDTDLGREELTARSWLHDFLKERIVTEIKGTYTWVSHGMVIGYNEREAVEFLRDPNKEEAFKNMCLEYKAVLLR